MWDSLTSNKWSWRFLRKYIMWLLKFWRRVRYCQHRPHYSYFWMALSTHTTSTHLHSIRTCQWRKFWCIRTVWLCCRWLVVMSWIMMTWRPICSTLTDGLVGRCPTSHHSVATSSAFLLPDLRRLAALSLTTECQGHSRKWRLEELLADGYTVLPDGALLQERMLSGLNVFAHGPLITYEQEVNGKSAL